MRENLINGESLAMIFREHSNKQILPLGAYVVPLGLPHVDVFVLNVE
jgi:hypothetical protein